MGRLTGKVAVVTGAAGGIGAAMVGRFLSEGAAVIMADLSEAAMRHSARSFKQDRLAYCEVDIRRSEDIERCTRQAVEVFGGLHIMMANAGIEGKVAPLVDIDVEEFDKVLATNVRGAFLSIKHSAPLIAASGGGAIIVTSSIAGLIGAAGLSAYVASKHAVMGLVKTAAIELAPLGIRVLSLNPGPVNNRMMQSIESQAAPGAAEAVHQAFEDKVPLHRYAENEEIASLAAFLASDEASYVTGAPFVIDGGYTAQ